MATFDDFINAWTIREWEVPADPPGPIPSNGFVRGQALGIMAFLDEKTDPGARIYDLTWKDGNGKDCRMTLPFHENGTLHHSNIPVFFAGLPVLAEVTLSIEADGSLTGTFGPPQSSDPASWGDGNTGTFIADANPGDDERAAT